MPADQQIDFGDIPSADPTKVAKASGGLDFGDIASAPPPKDAVPGYDRSIDNASGPGGDTIVENVKSLGRMARGAARGAVSTVQGIAAPIRSALGMQPAEPPTAETTTAGSIGRGVEQAGEFYAGGELASALGKVVKLGGALRARGMSALVSKFGQAAVEAALQGGAAGGVAAAQGDEHPGRAAALGAAGPVVGAIGEAAAPALAAGAKAGVGKLLTTGLSKTAADATEAPQIIAKAASTALDLGLQKSWSGWKQATQLARRGEGQKLEQLLAGPAGNQLIDKQPVIDALDDLIARKGTYLHPGIGTVPYNTPLIESARALKQVLQKPAGTYVEARFLHNVKQLWDTAVFGGKEGDLVLPLGDRLVNVDRLSRKTATDAIRSVFDSSAPNISDADDAVSQVIKLNKLVKKAAIAADNGGSTLARMVGRKTAQAAVGGLLGEEAGRHQGGVVGGTIGAVLGVGLASQVDRVIKSPMFKLAPAYLKQQLADAIVSGKADDVRRLLGPLVSSAAAGAPAAAGAGSSPNNPGAAAAPPVSATPTLAPATGSPR